MPALPPRSPRLDRPSLGGRDAAHTFDDGVPVVDFAVLRVDHDVLHAGRFIGGDPVAHHADILAVPVRAHRDREGGLGPVAAQALDHFAGLLRRHLAAVPTVADAHRAAV